MNNRIDAIYARQSIDKKDSISIESQIEFCKYELRGGSCKEYQDKGYSGKNTDRPQFQMLVEDIKRGLIAKVVVYKLDRISCFHSRLRKYDGFVSGVQRGVHILDREV